MTDASTLTTAQNREGWMEGGGSSGLVSVIVPTYNRAELVRQALASVWEQTYRPIELIVVDDGSEDETPSVVRDWKAEHESETFRVRLHSQENQGVGVARNQGLRMASGEYIQFLDSDDCLSEKKIETQVHTLADEKDDRVAFCETLFFGGGTEPQKTAEPTGTRTMSSSDDPVTWLLDLFGWDGEKGLVGIHAWLVPRSIVQDAGPWRRALVCDDDGEYFSRVVLKSSKVLQTDGCAYYRRHDGERLNPRRTASDWRDQLVATQLKEERLLDATTGDPEKRGRVRSFAARQYMAVAYRAFPAYCALSLVAEKWAKRRKETVSPPASHSFRSFLLESLLGWKGHRVISYYYYKIEGVI